MPSPFPSSNDNLSTTHAAGQTITSADIDAMASAVNAIQTASVVTPAPSKIPIANGSGKLAAGWVQEVLAFSDLTDGLTTTPAASHELIYDATNARWFNILHKRRAGGYVGIKGDGTTDDSTATATALGEINSAGKGWFEFEPYRTYRVANAPIYAASTMDLNGATLKLPDTTSANADVLQTSSFGSLTGGNTTGGPIRYRILGNGGLIDGNRATNSNGRHGLAMYGIGSVQDLFVKDCRGSGGWFEWASSGGIPSGYGDQTIFLDNIEAYDCESRTSVPGVDYTVVGGITAVTNTTNPTITTAQYHMLRIGQTITITGVVGATGVNTTTTVTTVPSATTFTITHASPGVYSSGGAITTPINAILAVIGADSARLRGIKVHQALANLTSGVGPLAGQRGLLTTGPSVYGGDIHIYQNVACAFDFKGDSPQMHDLYCGGHDQGILVRGNGATLMGYKVNGSFNNSVGVDYQSVGGTCSLLGGNINGLTSGSFCVRLWNTSPVAFNAACVGDGGSNTSTLYTAPNGTGGFHGFLRNDAFGVNASPASLIVLT